jgi:hypothetical protein
VWAAPTETDDFVNESFVSASQLPRLRTPGASKARAPVDDLSLHAHSSAEAQPPSSMPPLQFPTTAGRQAVTPLQSSTRLSESRSSQFHAPPLERTPRSVVLRDTPTTVRTVSRSLRTAHAGAAHGATEEPHAAVIAPRLTSVWAAYMAGSLRLAAQPGTVSAATRPAQYWDSPATRTDAARGGKHPTGPYSTRGTPAAGAATAAAVSAVPFFVGLSEDDAVGGDGEIVRLGAVRVGADYAYTFKLRNSTPFARRFRIIAAGWDDTPAAPRATMHVRFKALAIAPGLSAPLTMIFKVSEPGVLAGGVSIESDDGARLHARVILHAIEPSLFDRTRAAVAAEGNLTPLVAVAEQLEQNAATWDAEYARTGPVDARASMAAAPNPTLRGTRAEDWGWAPPKTPDVLKVTARVGGDADHHGVAATAAQDATSSRAASARTALLALTARGGGGGPWGDESAFADAAAAGAEGSGASADIDADAAALASSRYLDALTRAPASAIVGIAKDSGTTPGALLDATIRAQRGANGAVSTLDVVTSALEPIDAIVVDAKPIFPHLADIDRLPFVPNVRISLSHSNFDKCFIFTPRLLLLFSLCPTKFKTTETARATLALQSTPRHEKSRGGVGVASPVRSSASAPSMILDSEDGDLTPFDTTRSTAVSLAPLQLLMPLGGTHKLLVPLVSRM